MKARFTTAFFTVSILFAALAPLAHAGRWTP
jgi:hypothetical protein